MTQDFMEELRQDFILEAGEYVSMVRDVLGDPAAVRDPKRLEEAYRALHNMKGASQAVGYLKVSTLCQAMESVVSAAKRGGLSLETPHILTLGSALDSLSRLIQGEELNVGDLLKALKDLAEGRQVDVSSPSTPRAPQGETPPPGEPVAPADQPDRQPSPPAPQGSDTVRVRFSQVEELSMLLEDLIPLVLYAARKAEDLNQAAKGQAGNLRHLRELTKGLLEDVGSIDRSVKNLLDKVRQLSMLSASGLLRYLKEAASSLAIKTQKELWVSVSGGDVRLDRNVMESLKEPLVHLVRNSVDHGIEPPQDREASGKPRVGNLEIEISASGSVGILTVRDDGRGIDPRRLKQRALKDRLITPEEAEAMSDQEATELIFRSGFSTADRVTDVSGRGIGMSIVKETVERLGGSIRVESQVGHGTCFTLEFPVTMRTYQGVLVAAGGHLFSLPSSSVECSIRIERSPHPGMIRVKDRHLPLVPLGDLLSLKDGTSSKGSRPVAVVISSSGSSVAIQVDQVLGVHEGILKPLGEFLGKVRFFQGGVLLGNGSVVPVLNPSDLADSSPHGSSAGQGAQADQGPKRILVVEDSVTSRALLRNLMTSLGYQVTTAADGQEAWEVISRDPHHLVITDVEMPRMDGFELTRRIKGSPALRSIPVILVTSLESPEDVQRGIEAGADAHVPKGSFDQGRLTSLVSDMLG